MSIESYFFVGDLEQASGSEGRPEVENQSLFYRVMNTSVESLYSILEDGKTTSLDDVWTNEEYTSMTFAFPTEFVNSLCELEPSKTNDIVQKWLSDEDCPYDNTGDLTELLNSLVKLANVASNSPSGLYFRMEM